MGELFTFGVGSHAYVMLQEGKKESLCRGWSRHWSGRRRLVHPRDCHRAVWTETGEEGNEPVPRLVEALAGKKVIGGFAGRCAKTRRWGHGRISRRRAQRERFRVHTARMELTPPLLIRR